MKNPIRLLVAVSVLALGVFGLHVALRAQVTPDTTATAPAAVAPDATTPPAVAPAPAPAPKAETPAAAPDPLAAILTAYPKVTAFLSIFAALSAFYQVVIAFAHNYAAKTASPDDDAWLAKLEAQTWFKVLDRIFYWGGYLGAKTGGRKL